MAINLNLLGSFSTGRFDESAAEIPAFDPTTQRLFVVNADATTVDVLDISDPTNPTLIGSIDAGAFGDSANSVAVNDGILAIAIEAEGVTENGQVVFFDTNSDFSNPVNPVNTVEVGVLPDMLTFTPDGTKILVANEGEPDGAVDPQGSISIIDVSNGVENPTITTATFIPFNGQEEALRADGVRIFPDRLAARDLEPEYIAVSDDSTKAYVTLQENNAVAVVDINSSTVESILPLGLKNHNTGLANLTSFEFDADDRGNITNGGEDLLSALGETVGLGGFSGLWYDGVADNGNLKFITIPERGPDVGADGNDRLFVLPNYQTRVVSFELNEETGEVILTDETFLTREDGTTPITGLPNIPNVDRRWEYWVNL